MWNLDALVCLVLVLAGFGGLVWFLFGGFVSLGFFFGGGGIFCCCLFGCFY